jgi:hypothetical protein
MDFAVKAKNETTSHRILENATCRLRVNELLNDTFVLVAGEDSNSIPTEPI